MPRLSTIGRLLAKGAAEALPASADRVRIPQRRYGDDDVVLTPVEGAMRYAAVRHGIDALDALRHNLDIVLHALERSAAEHFVVSSDWGNLPVVGVRSAHLDRLWAALTESGAGAPIYAAASQGARPGRLVPGQVPPEIGPRFAVFTHLVDAPTQRRFGREHGCVIELWDEGADGSLLSLARTGATRCLVPASSRGRPVPVEVYGRAATTLEPLDRPPVFGVSFPVDAVYLWVDGEDPEWQARKAARLQGQGAPVAEDAGRASRFRQLDELRYSLRSLERFAPWVRHTFLVTDRQRPSWLDETAPGLTIVDHRDILPPDALPTFNSHALTAALHRIPGLTERFLYFNDDFFLGRPVNPNRFFLGNGTCRFFLSQTSVSPVPEVPHEAARVHSCDLIEARTGTRPTQVMKHIPASFDRRLLESLESELADEWHRTMHSPFRSPDDLVPEYLHHYLGYDRGLAAPGDISYRYFGYGTPAGAAAIAAYEREAPVEVFCVNDHGAPTAHHGDGDRSALASFLERQFPHPSSVELPPA